MLSHLLHIFYGLVFGIANIIPGVSGGTMLVVFGCYDKVCGALSMNLKEIKKNIVFLIFFGIGAVLGIVGFSFIITWLFENYPVATNMFFMGLIVGSVPLILRFATVKEKFKPVCIVPFIIGIALVIGLCIAENGTTDPYSFTVTPSGNATSITIVNNSGREVSSWQLELQGVEESNDFSLDTKLDGADFDTAYPTIDKIKGLFGMKIPALAPNVIKNTEGSVIPPNGSYTFTYNGTITEVDLDGLNVSYKMDVLFFLTMMGSLFVAAIAMIIPGVSGSFVMVTLGVYSTIIAAIKNFDIAIIIPCAIGAVIGLVLGARIITMLMKKYSLMVYSVILGLVAGSLYAILPQGFGFNIQTLIGVFAFIAGGALAFITGRKTSVNSEENAPAKKEA